jgi:hypothetical protein
MTFIDFIGYGILLKILKSVLSIAACIGLYFLVHWLLNDKNKRGD